jgi:hypothetical protein
LGSARRYGTRDVRVGFGIQAKGAGLEKAIELPISEENMYTLVEATKYSNEVTERSEDS